jgi:hypothetical protein
MAMGTRERDEQGSFWIPTSALPTTASHPFYEHVNRILDGRGFDGFVEELCRRFYHQRMGRPSLAAAGITATQCSRAWGRGSRGRISRSRNGVAGTGPATPRRVTRCTPTDDGFEVGAASG